MGSTFWRNSRLIIYLPDSGFPPAQASDFLYDGARLVEIVRWLESHVGPPMESGKLFDEAAFAESVYLVERI